MIMPAWLPSLIIVSLSWLLSGCSGDSGQSALNPFGEGAASIAKLWWFMLVLGAIVFSIVIVMFAVSLATSRTERSEASRRREVRFVIIAGIVIPLGVLVVLLFPTFSTTARFDTGKDELEIVIIGNQYWWRVEYPSLGVTTANELALPVGRRVGLRMRSSDVIHSLWIPNLHGKMDVLPEHWTRLQVRAEKTGRLRGQCAEFCGIQHARMALTVTVLNEADFADWIDRRSRPALPAKTAEHTRGRDVFFQAGCDACHSIRGTAAGGEVGPDLTHLGLRPTLGAGTLPNSKGALAGWIANPQALKPGNAMPRSYLAANDLHLLVDYLLRVEQGGHE